MSQQGMHSNGQNGLAPHSFTPQNATLVSNCTFTPNEFTAIQHELTKYLGPENVSTRPGAGGVRLSYIEGCKVINIANELFGFNGWSSQIQNMTIDYLDYENGAYNIGVSCVMRVTLKDGTFHEDVGYGVMERAKTKSQAFEKAKKEAATDALKRALRSFGNCLGNCLYNKQYLKLVNKFRKESEVITEDRIYRSRKMGDFHEPKASPSPALAQPAEDTSIAVAAATTPSSSASKDPRQNKPSYIALYFADLAARPHAQTAKYTGSEAEFDDIEINGDDDALNDLMDAFDGDDPDIGRPIISESLDPRIETQINSKSQAENSPAQSTPPHPQWPPPHGGLGTTQLNQATQQRPSVLAGSAGSSPRTSNPAILSGSLNQQFTPTNRRTSDPTIINNTKRTLESDLGPHPEDLSTQRREHAKRLTSFVKASDMHHRGGASMSRPPTNPQQQQQQQQQQQNKRAATASSTGTSPQAPRLFADAQPIHTNRRPAGSG
ncbi:DNA repair protein rad52 [Spiromyces aspiralis]|uniref:DNA repair protein rad52 n=1 Tax=Spiromyces aspiralis TaxID=68401 RepID=A0ACC1HUR0_9FUNG|nr:DNA repair protein rad52 [Spiromyces aspiralis]